MRGVGVAFLAGDRGNVDDAAVLLFQHRRHDGLAADGGTTAERPFRSILFMGEVLSLVFLMVRNALLRVSRTRRPVAHPSRRRAKGAAPQDEDDFKACSRRR